MVGCTINKDQIDTAVKACEPYDGISYILGIYLKHSVEVMCNTGAELSIPVAATPAYQGKQ